MSSVRPVDDNGAVLGGKASIAALTLAAAAASGQSSNFSSNAGQGASVVIDITAITGTSPTLTVIVEGCDPHSGKYYTILQSAALAAVGTTVLRIGRGLTAAANLVANDQMPQQWRVSYTIGGTTPAVTAKVGVLLA